MSLHNPAAPADPDAAQRMLDLLPGSLHYLRDFDPNAGPYHLVPVHDVGQLPVIEAAMTAYPGVTIPSVHTVHPRIAVGSVRLTPVPDMVEKLLWEYAGIEDFRIYTDDSWSPATLEPPTEADFAKAVALQLTHRYRDGSTELAAAAERAMAAIGPQAVCDVILNMPPIGFDDLYDVAILLNGIAD